MPNTPAFIAGDWGTSNLTLALCDAGGDTLEMRKGPGAAESRGRFAQTFDELTASWLASGQLIEGLQIGRAHV